ncbi:hypothetical protein GCM10010387_62960 [Streptomyces inusitatus]|uniref:Uncharacterized protein n=1 Tax=Streptomyces inusitatus TaxID=68221 RepID=A0A918QP80_9ACTN|nr:hypothetical protein GCM10010387_62960 [Streptomyces inusitatus]
MGVGVVPAHIWDASTVAALDAIELKYVQRGKTVEIIGLKTPVPTSTASSPGRAWWASRAGTDAAGSTSHTPPGRGTGSRH